MKGSLLVMGAAIAVSLATAPGQGRVSAAHPLL